MFVLGIQRIEAIFGENIQERSYYRGSGKKNEASEFCRVVTGSPCMDICKRSCAVDKPDKIRLYNSSQKDGEPS